MKKVLAIIIFSLIQLFPAFAENKFSKVCEMSKRTMQKNPACSAELKESAMKVDCNVDGGHTQMNDLQKKCSSSSTNQGEKLAELKAKDPSDPKIQELKQKLEAAKAAKSAAH